MNCLRDQQTGLGTNNRYNSVFSVFSFSFSIPQTRYLRKLYYGTAPLEKVLTGSHKTIHMPTLDT